MLFYKLIKYWNRKITIVIAFLSAVSAIGLASLGSTISASIDYSDSASEEEPFKVLVTVAGVEGNCGEEV